MKQRYDEIKNKNRPNKGTANFTQIEFLIAIFYLFTHNYYYEKCTTCKLHCK